MCGGRVSQTSLRDAVGLTRFDGHLGEGAPSRIHAVGAPNSDSVRSELFA